MKIDSRQLALCLAAAAGTSAYLPSNLPNRPAFGNTQLYSSTSADADFSAFADSLEAEDEPATAAASTTSKSTSTTSNAEKPWQAKLEELFDPMTSPAQRQILLSELLNANEKIRESVLDALSNRKVSFDSREDKIVVNIVQVQQYSDTDPLSFLRSTHC